MYELCFHLQRQERQPWGPIQTTDPRVLVACRECYDRYEHMIKVLSNTSTIPAMFEALGVPTEEAT